MPSRVVSSAPAADHVLEVLSLLAGQAEPLTAGLIATRLGLPRSTTYRLLAVLRDHGYVVHIGEDRRYAVGLAAYELGTAYQRQGPFQRVARPILHRLVDQVRQNAHLAVLQGRDVFYVIEERAAGRSSLVSDVGVRLPATVTASGLAMLSRLSAAQVRALFPSSDTLTTRDGRGPTSVTELRRMLTDVRNRGHAVEDGFVTEGLYSVAQPVLDQVGHPVAAVAITVVDADVDAEEKRRLVLAVTRAADSLSRRVGGH